MRPVVPLVLALIFFTLGCAGPRTSVTNHGLEAHTHTCLSDSSLEMDHAVSSSCRPEPRLLEKVGIALGGFAATMRNPIQ